MAFVSTHRGASEAICQNSRLRNQKQSSDSADRPRALMVAAHMLQKETATHPGFEQAAVQKSILSFQRAVH